MFKKKITQCIIILILTIFIFIGMSFKVSKMTPYVNLININIIMLIISSNIFLLFIYFNNRILKGLVDLISFSAISYLSLCIIFGFIVIPSNVSQSSMYPTLENNDQVLVYHLNYIPKSNDVVVIKVSDQNYPNIPKNNDLETSNFLDSFYVKRIYGIPGDEVSFTKSDESSNIFKLFINGVEVLSPLSSPYFINLSQKKLLESQLINNLIPMEKYFVLGDNPELSLDSRSFGLVSKSDIIGTVVFKLWNFEVIK